MAKRTARRSERVDSITRKPKIEKSSEHKQEEIALTALDYVNKKRSISLLEKDVKKIRPTLEAHMDKNEVELPNGGKMCVIPYVDVEIQLKRSLRTSAKLTEDAMDILEELGIVEEVIEMQAVINERVLEEMISTGKISEADALRLYEVKKSYAFSVDTTDKFDEE